MTVVKLKNAQECNMHINAYHYYLMVVCVTKAYGYYYTCTHSNLIMHDICLLYEHINCARHNDNDTLITHLITIAFLVIRKISYSLV